MKTLLLAVLLCSYVAQATPTTVVVAQNIVGHDGSQASGTVTIRSVTACTIGSDYVEPTTKTVKFTGGAFTVDLVANDACLPSTPYLVTWNIKGSVQTETERWFVTTSSTPLRVTDVVVDPPASTLSLIQLRQLNATTYATGQYCVNVVSGKVTGLVACNTSSPPVMHWSTLTSSTWATLTGTQWASLAN